MPNLADRARAAHETQQAEQAAWRAQRRAKIAETARHVASQHVRQVIGEDLDDLGWEIEPVPLVPDAWLATVDGVRLVVVPGQGLVFVAASNDGTFIYTAEAGEWCDDDRVRSLADIGRALAREHCTAIADVLNPPKTPEQAPVPRWACVTVPGPTAMAAAVAELDAAGYVPRWIFPAYSGLLVIADHGRPREPYEEPF